MAARITRTLSRLRKMIIRRLPRQIESRAWRAFRAIAPQAERYFGTREAGFRVLDIKQADEGPVMKFDGQSITLVVGPNATAYEPTLISNIAHETVHSLSPRTGDASMLEEGAAVYFELSVINARYGAAEKTKFLNFLPSLYREALTDFEQLLKFDKKPGRTIRSTFGSMTDVSKRELRDLYDELDGELADRLVKRKRMR